ncbi:MAG TPA: hypothetical protein VGM10_17690 [Actinocrinis sp.]
MSHVGRRIATTAAAAAAVALPIAAAGSAFADTTGLPVAGLAQGLPVAGLPSVGDLGGVSGLTSGIAPLGSLTQGVNSPLGDLGSGNGLSGVTDQLAGQSVSSLPVVGPMAGNLPVANSLTGAPQNAPATAAPAAANPLGNAISAPQQQAAAAGAQAVQDYTGKHRK